MQIREATVTDEAQLRVLVKEFFEGHRVIYGDRADFITPKDLNAFDKDIAALVKKILKEYPKGQVFVAEENSRLVGYVDVNWKEWFVPSVLPKMGNVDMMYVQEPYRSQGLGKKLLDKATEWFRSQGVEAAQLEVAEMNEKAVEFYRREGYRPYNIVMRRKFD